MKEWLEDIVKTLQGIQSLQHQFVSATCIACCLNQCSIEYEQSKSFLFPLLRLLQIQPDTERRICPQYTFLCDLLVQKIFWYESLCVYRLYICNFWCTYHFSRNIAAALQQLCKQAIKAVTTETYKDWLYVLPFYHFIKDNREPFTSPEYDPEKIVFKTGLLELIGSTWKLPKGLVLI